MTNLLCSCSVRHVKRGSIVLPAVEGQFDVLILVLSGPLNHRFARKLVTWTKLHGQGLLKCQISRHHGNHLNGEMPERLNGPVSKTGVGQLYRGSNPLSPPLYQWLISRLPALLFLNRTIVEYSWRVRSSLFSVRYCDIQHLIRYGSDRKLSSENVQLFSRFLIAHHYSFRHSSYETAAKLVVGTEVA